MFDDGVVTGSSSPQPGFHSMQYTAATLSPYEPAERMSGGSASAGHERSATRFDIRQYFEEFATLLRSLC